MKNAKFWDMIIIRDEITREMRKLVRDRTSLNEIGAVEMSTPLVKVAVEKMRFNITQEVENEHSDATN
jgi:hypothetical protein